MNTLKVKRGYLTERVETSVEPDLADWIAKRAARKDRPPASIVREALRVYRALDGEKLDRILADIEKVRVAA